MQDVATRSLAGADYSVVADGITVDKKGEITLSIDYLGDGVGDVLVVEHPLVFRQNDIRVVIGVYNRKQDIDQPSKNKILN